MLALWCVVVGEEAAFSVKVAGNNTVAHLKAEIKAKNRYQFPAHQMQLYRVEGLTLNDQRHWHFHGRPVADMSTMQLSDFAGSTTKLTTMSLVSNCFNDTDAELTPGKVHILVKRPDPPPPPLPPSCRPMEISISDLLQQNPLPSMEFTEAMKQPLGFKIPIRTPRYVSLFPDSFVEGTAEYGVAVDVVLQHTMFEHSQVEVATVDTNWLNLFVFLCQCVVHRDQCHDSDSPSEQEMEAVVVKQNAMVGKCVTRASWGEMTTATNALTYKLGPAAYCTFPDGLTSIPAWTTSSTIIQLHQLTYNCAVQSYSTRQLKTYHVSNLDGRHQFVVDVFKVLKWVGSIPKPHTTMHLVPGIRTVTRHHGHYLTWVKSGLVKQFQHDDKINMAVMDRIYRAPLQHVERGRCHYTSVTITSIGQTLKTALSEDLVSRDTVKAQVRSALDELHSLGLAHCNVRAANVFVLLEDKRVILGDLESCRPVDAAPPQVCPNKIKTALELDEYQFGTFVDELATM
ncbi:hypothetical protein DYB30_004094 [Aphanomyces astaci]|uniref:Crinkler effector protein N-terminal domain-containing protein n=1 Tax=Aphanomyces astaci TaxID=112090 RepID=A0A397D9E0_APHAT|nr:hypothetical protein DYB30_004094 [Aphanomyces astaci]